MILRPWRRTDREPFAELNVDPDVMRHYPSIRSWAESDATADRIEAHFEEFGFGQTEGGSEDGDASIVLVASEIRELKVNADAYSFDYDEGFIAMCLDIDRFASGNADESLRLVSID